MIGRAKSKLDVAVQIFDCKIQRKWDYNMKDECLLCGAPLKYLENDELMECAVCHKKENSKTVCENGHYICNECHTQGMDSIVGVCLAKTSKNPVEIIQKMMALPFCHMHGPEHHVLVGSALLTATRNKIISVSGRGVRFTLDNGENHEPVV